MSTKQSSDVNPSASPAIKADKEPSRHFLRVIPVRTGALFCITLMMLVVAASLLSFFALAPKDAISRPSFPLIMGFATLIGSIALGWAAWTREYKAFIHLGTIVFLAYLVVLFALGKQSLDLMLSAVASKGQKSADSPATVPILVGLGALTLCQVYVCALYGAVMKHDQGKKDVSGKPGNAAFVASLFV